MFDLIFSYLLITTILFSANIGLFFGNFRLNNIKSIFIFLLIGIIFFIVLFTSNLIAFNLNEYLSYIFILISIMIFIIMILNLKANNKLMPLIFITVLYYITSFLLAVQLNEHAFNSLLLLSIVSIIVMIVAFQSSKLLIFAKRPYDVIIGEFMSLFGVLIFIFGLTHKSIMNLDYGMFSSFLILTPTYQLIYVIIGIIIVLIIGSYWNDKKNLR